MSEGGNGAGRRIVTYALELALWFSVAAMALLAFVWPFAVSPEPSQPLFKALAVGTLASFLAALAGLLALRARR